MTPQRHEPVPHLDAPPASRSRFVLLGRLWPRKSTAVAVVALLLLYLTHPLLWHRPMPAWWYPQVGLGIVLVAWLGRRAVVLVAAAVLLVDVQAHFTGAATAGWADRGWPVLGRFAWDAGLLAAEVLVAWGGYHHFARGTRRLGDPRSATLFLVWVGGIVAGVFAFLNALPLYAAGPGHALAPWHLDAQDLRDLGELVGVFWLAHALGILAVAPPLLATLTTPLVRHGLAVAEPSLNPRDVEEPGAVAWGDVLEIAGLALAMALFGLLQALIYRYQVNPADPQVVVPNWQLWGLPFLIIVWVSLRQGQRGGIVVASSAVVLALLYLSLVNLPTDPLEQGNLLGQCAAALLVAAAANWIRLSEARYRQVVTRIPVVLYSARVTQLSPDGGGLPRAELTFVSPAAWDLLDADPDRLLGDYLNWVQHVHPDDREVVVAALAQMVRHNRPVTCEYRLAAPARPADGDSDDEPSVIRALRSALQSAYGAGVIALQPPPARHRWVRDTMAPQYDPAGRLEGWDGVLSDITEPRVLADDLRRTTSMFHALVANLPAGVFFVQGQAGQPILVNARARHLLGRPEDASTSIDQLVTTYRLCRPDGSPYPTDELPVVTALRRGASSMRDDIVVHRPDGRRLPLITWAAPIDLSGHGRPDAAVWVFEDLTALHQAEAARRESEARLRTVFETMAEGVVILDERAVLLECNPAACAILGRPAERLRGNSWLDPAWHFLAEDGTPLAPDAHPAAVSLRTGLPVRNVVIGVMAPAEGVLRWLLVNAVPLPGRPGDGRPARLLTTFADITAYRQALDVVRASEEKYRVLVETLPIMLVQLDRDGGVTYMNPAAQSVSGYDLADLNARGSWEALVHLDDLAQAREAFQQALTGQTTRVEFRYRAKDGSEKVGYAIAEPRVQGGAVAGVTSLIVDMTRERELERELQQAQRLELIGRLSSGIAHDFNNLLTVILTLAELAKHNLPADHPARDDLRRIAYAGEQAANLAHQLLAFSKNRRPVPRRLDVNRVARRTLELLRATLPRAVHVEEELAGGELPVEADEMQLQQVLMNLCLNARDAMPHGGRLLVRTARGPGSVRLSVEDEGEGIPEGVQARIFDPFFSTKEHGTGLGLAMVRQIVESYGGRVEVWSRLGEGARFDVWLPAAGAPAVDEAGVLPGAAAG